MSMDNRSCPKCRHYNAMLAQAHRENSRHRTLLKCRDCGYESIGCTVTCRLSLRTVRPEQVGAGKQYYVATPISPSMFGAYIGRGNTQDAAMDDLAYRIESEVKDMLIFTLEQL